MNSKIIKAIFLQFSGIMGAGIFALPFVFYQSNFTFSIFTLLFVALFLVLLNLFYAEIILKTSGDHQFSGYAQIYLGSKFKILSLFNLFIIGSGALLAYFKLSTSFLPVLFPALTPSTSLFIFILLLAIFHLIRLRSLNAVFQVLPLISIILILFIFTSSFNFLPVNTNAFFPSFSFIGVMIFALSGFTILPEVEEILRGSQHKEKLFKFSTIAGVILAVLMYILFSYAVIRISHNNLSADSVTGLLVTSPILGKILSLLGLAVILKASLNFLLISKEIFFRDLKFSQNNSYLFSFLISLLTLVFINISFLNIISFIGTLNLFISTILICFIRLKLPHTRSTNFIAILLILFFTVGLSNSLTFGK